jgi:signal transduction histidine kinase
MIATVEDKTKRRAPQEKDPNSQTDRLKVLIVDDDRGPRESLRMLLNKEYQVHCADNVDDGLSLLSKEVPDVVIMDIRMPGKSGIEGLKELRSIDKQAAVIMLTGYGALETAQEALRLGANDYINKPFDTDEMCEIVRKFTRQSRVERRRVAMLKELQDMNSHLMEDIAMKDHLATLGQTSAEFAHDLRNPLMIVQGYVELLTSQLEESRHMIGSSYGQVTDYLEIIEKNVQRCCELATMWQSFDHTDLSAYQSVPVSQLVEDLMVSIEPLIVSVDVELEYQVEHGGVAVSGSRPQLLRAVHNLVSNAIDAVDPGRGRILFSCDVHEGEVRLCVKDNGTGMTPDVQEKMFEPYFTTKEDGKGTGLGTVITQRIIDEHNGRIEVDSSPGNGTTMTILLPIHHE